MSEEMNKQQEEVKAEAPAETMEDYAAELEASYKHLMRDTLNFRRQMMQKEKSGLNLHR